MTDTFWMAGCMAAYCAWTLAKITCVVVYWTLNR